MSAPPSPASAITSTDEHEHVVVRCLDGAQLEHRAREVTVGVLIWSGLTDEVFEAELAVSELVTNARRHAPPPYELRVHVSASSVRIAVVDGGTDHAELAVRLAGATAGRPAEGESGRGLQLVAGLFPRRCGADPTTTSVSLVPAKQVWITCSVLPADRR